MKALNRLSLSSVLVPPKTLDKPNDDLLIKNVALALPLDEEDREVDPTVLLDTSATGWTVFASGVGTWGATLTVENGKAKIVIGSGTSQYVGITRTHSVDLSSKSIVRWKWTGENSGVAWTLRFRKDSTNYFDYSFTDNFIGDKDFVLPQSSFTAVGSPTWAAISSYSFFATSNTAVASTSYAERLAHDIGVPALDYSGNGNHGAATGTTVQTTDTLWVNKNNRLFSATGDIITLPFAASVRGSGIVTFATYLKLSVINRRHLISFESIATSSSAARMMLEVTSANKVRLSGRPTSADAGLITFALSSNTLQANVWYTIVAVFNSVTDTHKIHVAEVLTTNAVAVSAVDDTAPLVQPKIGSSGVTADDDAKALLAGFYRFSGEPSDLTVFSSGYPDPTLIEGSVVVRGKVVSGCLNKRIGQSTVTGEAGLSSAELDALYAPLVLEQKKALLQIDPDADVTNEEIERRYQEYIGELSRRAQEALERDGLEDDLSLDESA